MTEAAPRKRQEKPSGNDEEDEGGFKAAMEDKAKISLLYWYPKIKGRVPTPDTKIFMLPEGWHDWLDSGVSQAFLTKLRAENSFGYPVFMRTDMMACKHSWVRSCFVNDRESLGRNLSYLIEENMISDMFGESAPSAIVFREFLHLKTYFQAYQDMPVAREWRFFATGGVIDCYHPYWPHGALENGHPHTPHAVVDWEAYLPELESEDGLPFEIVKVVSRLFPEQWSIDVCQDVSGQWFVTDMATGRRSYHWKHGTKDGGGREESD